MTDSHPLPSIDLDLPRKLQDPAFRERFFLAEASAEIARQLIRLRKRRGLSQAELAERADTHQPAVSRAEQADYHNWSFNALRKLTNAMGGRLRVVIDPWEDVLPEYYPEDHEPIVAPPHPSGPKDAKPKEGGRKRLERQSAAFGGEAPTPDGERKLNVERDVSAKAKHQEPRDRWGSQWN